MTFSSEQARKQPSLEFVTMHHPLAQMAINHWREVAMMRGAADPQPAMLSIKGPVEEAGTAWFFLFGVSVQGVNKKESIEVVVLRQSDGRQLPETQRHFLHHVQQQAPSTPPHDLIDRDAFAHWHERASQVMATRRDDIERLERLDNTARIESRMAAVEASVSAKAKRLQERAAKAANDNILRMTNSQIRNVRARMEHDLQELERSREVVVSSRLIAGGQVLIHTETELVDVDIVTPALHEAVAPEPSAKDMETEWRSLLRGWVRR